jgi:hypothetical protein
MGTPSPTEPWGWQLDGHHLIINFFVLGDQIVMTSAFWGSEPVVATTGKYAGTRIMDAEQTKGLAMINGSCSASLRSARTCRVRSRNVEPASVSVTCRVVCSSFAPSCVSNAGFAGAVYRS